MIDQERCDYMFGLVEQWQQSGQTQKDFCLSNDLKTSTFSEWCQRYRKHHDTQSGKIKTGTFQELKLPIQSLYTITYPNGVQLTLPVACDLSTLQKLIHLV